MSYQSGPSGGILDNVRAYDTSERGDQVVKICGVYVQADKRIDQIKIEWLDTKGGTIWSKKIGGEGGKPNPIWQIALDEHLIAITGTLVNYNSLRLLSIQFCTEKSSSPIYGTQPEDPGDFCAPAEHPETDHYFSFQCPPGYQIIDLFGWADAEVDSLGVYIEQIKP